MTVARTDSGPLSRTDTRRSGTRHRMGTAALALQRLDRSPVEPVKEKRGPGAVLLLVLAPLLCCGGPLLLGAAGTAAAATIAAAGGLFAGLITLATVGYWLRGRRRAGAACCSPGTGTWRP